MLHKALAMLLLLLLTVAVPARADETGAGEEARSGSHGEEEGGPSLEVVSAQLTAGGGLVDIRYRLRGITEQTRLNHANSFLSDEATGDKFTVQGVAKIGNLAPSEVKDPNFVYYALFQNRGRKIQPGSVLTVVISGMRQEHVEVR